MSNIRTKFLRGEEVKYISHLDLMKVFERAIRRAGLPIAYSQGFNPHPQMVFGLPMSVGVTSEAEYADFELSQDMDADTFTEALNKALPTGLKILDSATKNSRDNIMASISFASYELLLVDTEGAGINELKEKIGELQKRSELTVKKEGKRGTKDVDILPMIQRLEFKMLDEHMDSTGNNGYAACDCNTLIEYAKKLKEDNEQHENFNRMFCLCALLSAGSAANLKPDLMIQAFNEAGNLKLKVVKIHRTGLYIGKEGKIMNPLDAAVL